MSALRDVELVHIGSSPFFCYLTFYQHPAVVTRHPSIRIRLVGIYIMNACPNQLSVPTVFLDFVKDGPTAYIRHSVEDEQAI